MLEALKTVFAGEAPETSEMLATSIAELEAELKKAKAAAAERRQEHDGQTLKLLAEGETKTLTVLRTKRTAAETRVAELESALESAQRRHEAAVASEEAERERQTWIECGRLLDRRMDAVKRIAGACRELGEAMLELREAENEVWYKLPRRPRYRTESAGMLALNGLQSRVELLLSIASAGMFENRIEPNVHEANRRYGDWIGDTEKLHAGLMSFQFRTEGE